MPQELRAVEWTGSGLALIDQTLLPYRAETRDVRDVDTLVDAIQRLVVRGAPAIGAAGAYGVALALLQGKREGWSEAEVRAAVARVREARPTAVNLMVCVDRVMTRFGEGLDAVLEEAAEVQREDVSANRAMGASGADWLLERVDVNRPLRILTHCNTGALATAGWGTALGVIRELHARGRLEVVYADETRPLLQGSRLTAWELVQEGIPHYVQADGAAAGTILRGEVDAAVVGADRIAANGDTANKVGTVGVALALRRRGHPVPGGGTDDHGGPLHRDRRRHPHRTPRRGGGAGVGWDTDGSGTVPRPQPGLRRDSGAPGVGVGDRAGRAGGLGG